MAFEAQKFEIFDLDIVFTYIIHDIIDVQFPRTEKHRQQTKKGENFLETNKKMLSMREWQKNEEY
jgi:hypothetical protein